MASASSLAASFSPATPPDAMARAELSEIDASTRWPVVVFLLSSLVWLLVGTGFAIISSIKLHTPEFLGGYEWLTFGRARTAHLNSMVFGWSTNVAFAVAFWLMARLSRATLRHAGLLVIAACFWNLGVALGVIGILAGDSTSIEWLEIPPYATPLLFVAYALIGVWAIITFRFRKAEHVYVSQWYLLAALFWFPWLYSIAQIMLVFAPARGTVRPSGWPPPTISFPKCSGSRSTATISRCSASGRWPSSTTGPACTTSSGGRCRPGSSRPASRPAS